MSKCILNKLIENGLFVFQEEPVVLLLDNGVSVNASRDRDLDTLEFRFINTLDDNKCLLSVLARRLCSLKESTSPTYSMSMYDDYSYYSDFGGDIETFEKLIHQSDYARKSGISLLKALRKDEVMLVNESDIAFKANALRDKKQSDLNEERRLKRIATYEDKYDKIGLEVAQEIVAAIEDYVFTTKQSTTRTYEFLKQDGYPTNKTIDAIWEKERLSWKDKRHNLMDRDAVIELISKGRILK